MLDLQPEHTSDPEKAKAQLKERCGVVFKEMDLDSSGHITLSELKSATDKMGLKLSDEEVKEMLETADHNDDQTICLDEFNCLMEKEYTEHHKKVVGSKSAETLCQRKVAGVMA